MTPSGPPKQTFQTIPAEAVHFVSELAYHSLEDTRLSDFYWNLTCNEV